MLDNELIDDLQSRQRNQELDQLIPLLVKTSYDSTLNGLLLEHLFLNNKGNESQLEQYRQKAIELIEKRFEKEGIQEQSLTIDRLTKKVQQQVELLDKQDKQLQQYKEQLQQYKDHINKTHSAIRDLKTQYEQLIIWTNDLIQYLKSNYSRIKSNESLIDDFSRKKPLPKGIRI